MTRVVQIAAGQLSRGHVVLLHGGEVFSGSTTMYGSFTVVGTTNYEVSGKQAINLWTYDCRDQPSQMAFFHEEIVSVVKGGRIECVIHEAEELWYE